MTRRHPWSSLFLLLCAAVAVAQAPDPAAPAAPKKATEWPTLKEVDKDKVIAQVAQFRKSDPDLFAPARAALVQFGDAAAPILFVLCSDAAGNVNEQLFLVFDAMLTARHSALLVRECKKPKVELRRYLVRRLARFGEAELLPALQALVADKDPETSFFASLGCLALGDQKALPAVMTYTKTQWKAVGPLVAEVLPMGRSHEAGAAVFAAIAKAPVPEQMAGLRLARYLALKEQSVIVRTYLQAADHQVKKEAVNTMRVLYGQEPAENLTVFEAIKQANEWLTKA